MKPSKIFVPVVFGALTLAGAQAQAAGTNAGVEITNTASLNYAVNGQDQSISAVAKVDVDLRLDFKLTTNNTAIQTSSLPDAATEIEVADIKIKNDSNAPTTYEIAIADKAINQVAKLYGATDDTTDNFNLTSPNFSVVATGGAQVAVSGSTITITKLAEDASTDITISVDKASFQGTLNGASVSIFDFTAKATQAFDNDDAAIDVASQSSGAKDTDLSTVQVVYADADRNNSESVSEGLSLTLPYFPTDPTDPTDPTKNGLIKTNTVVWDPLNGATNPKAIPGAVVEYKLAVRNLGTTAATDLVVVDNIPADTTYCTSVQPGANGDFTCVAANAADDDTEIGSAAAVSQSTSDVVFNGTTYTADTTNGTVFAHYPTFNGAATPATAKLSTITFYVVIK